MVIVAGTFVGAPEIAVEIALCKLLGEAGFPTWAKQGRAMATIATRRAIGKLGKQPRQVDISWYLVIVHSQAFRGSERYPLSPNINAIILAFLVQHTSS